MAEIEWLHPGFHDRWYAYLTAMYPGPGVDADEFFASDSLGRAVSPPPRLFFPLERSANSLLNVDPATYKNIGTLRRVLVKNVAATKDRKLDLEQIENLVHELEKN
jgi:hypothetical protein